MGNEINSVIAKNLNSLLAKTGKTQIDLSLFMNVSQATVSNWCKGLKMPRMDKIDKICSFFNISRSDLMEEKPEPTEIQSKDTKEHISNMIKNEYGITTHKAFGLLVRLDDLDKEKTIERMEVYLEDDKYLSQKGILDA